LRNIRPVEPLKRKLAVLLLISFVNLIASPFLLASRSTVVAAPFDGPTDFIRKINLMTNDLVYSSTTGKIYASIPSSVGPGGNSIAAIDPATGSTTSSTFIGSDPNKLALSDDGHSLYVSLDGTFAVRRFDALTNTPGAQFPLGQDPSFGRYIIGDFAVAPGSPDTLAIARWYLTVSPREAGVAVYDNGVRRPNTGPGHLNGADSIAYSASASKLYGTGQFQGVQTITVDASGVTVSNPTIPALSGRVKFSNGLLFTSFGQVANPDTNTLLGTFPSVNTTAFVPDTANGRAYYLTTSQTQGTLILRAFDINTFLPLGTLNITGVSGNATSLLRWGANGLAFRTTGNQLFIIQTSLIPSAEPIPTPTPTPSPTPSPSPSPAAPAFVRQMTLTTNDLVFSEATQKLYASVPSSEGSTGNSVAEIDPVLGSISNQTFVGSEPTQLGQADDGATLYVNLDGAAAIRRYNIVTHTAGQQFFIGRENSFGPYVVSGLAVTPGNPSVIAVARQRRGGFPDDAGVAIFDNGVQRAISSTPQTTSTTNVVFASPSLLYGNGNNGFTKFAVDNSGVLATGFFTLAGGNQISLANNRVYGSTGQVLDASTGELLGTFLGASSPTHVIDVANNRAFYLTNQNGFVQIKAYDLNTFLPLGFINLFGVVGGSGDLVRWGTNGLAFRTDNRQLFLIQTELVNASVPVATPTPSPSPTPSPTPPYVPTFIRRLDLPANDLVYSEATQSLYVTLPSSVGASGNSITKINPTTGVIGPSVFIGSEPNKMTISNDGQTIWTFLSGASATRGFDVLTQTAGVQFTTGANPPLDMDVVPGSPHALALSRFNNGFAIFDDGVQRPNAIANPLSAQIEFGADPSTLYGPGKDLTKYVVNASGITQSSMLEGFWPNPNKVKFSDGLLFSNLGTVADPETGLWKGTFKGTNFQSTLAVDAANHRVFFATSSGQEIVITGFDSNTFLPVGSITLPGTAATPISLVRWGTNGLALNTAGQFASPPGQFYIFQTELVSNASPIPTGFQVEADKLTFFESSFDTFPVKVSRTGDVSQSVSVNYATADGTAIAGSDYTAVSGTLNFAPGELSKTVLISITDDSLFENAEETFTFNLSNPTGGALITSPTSTITILDGQFKPQMFVSFPVKVNEGDSGTSNLAVNVNLSTPSVQVITVDYATVNGSATAGSDYTSVSGKLTIPAGAASGTINIPITGDTTIEPDETFTLNLTNATNVGFNLSPTVTVTIVNDDATLQFNNAASSVNESAGFATVTVTRVGDTSRLATVQYATTDTAGLQNCTLANGKASERCDYATAVGLLQFGIGQTTKSIFIPVVNDALVEGDETFTINLNAATGAILATPTAATITIVDNDSTPATQNPVDGVTFFITQQYIDFLGRLPDSIGLANWTDTLGNCPNGGFGEFDNPNCDRVHVSSGFFLSDEFRGRGYWAYKFYEVGFDRRPLYAEFVPDMAQVGGPQSPQSEALSKAAYMDAFVQRTEFKNRYDALSNSAYVDALETNAEVTVANKAALVTALNGNQKTRAQVLREIVELPGVEDKFFIRAFVAMQYFGYLRRDPDTVGYNNWVTTLTADPSNSRHMIFGFIFSDEYRHRFGP
jgi:hypothetical protein